MTSFTEGLELADSEELPHASLVSASVGSNVREMGRGLILLRQRTWTDSSVLNNSRRAPSLLYPENLEGTLNDMEKNRCLREECERLIYTVKPEAGEGACWKVSNSESLNKAGWILSGN